MWKCYFLMKNTTSFRWTCSYVVVSKPWQVRIPSRRMFHGFHCGQCETSGRSLYWSLAEGVWDTSWICWTSWQWLVSSSWCTWLGGWSLQGGSPTLDISLNLTIGNGSCRRDQLQWTYTITITDHLFYKVIFVTFKEDIGSLEFHDNDWPARYQNIVSQMRSLRSASPRFTSGGLFGRSAVDQPCVDIDIIYKCWFLPN